MMNCTIHSNSSIFLPPKVSYLSIQPPCPVKSVDIESLAP